MALFRIKVLGLRVSAGTHFGSQRPLKVRHVRVVRPDARLAGQSFRRGFICELRLILLGQALL